VIRLMLRALCVAPFLIPAAVTAKDAAAGCCAVALAPRQISSFWGEAAHKPYFNLIISRFRREASP
jgi:hypothetical protein